MEFILALLLSFNLVAVAVSQESGSYETIVTGRVVDSSGKPMGNVWVLAQQCRLPYERGYIWWGSSKRAYSNSDGTFMLKVDWEGDTFVGALFDKPESLGMDYVPSLQWMEVRNGNTYNISFKLIPGASLMFDLDDISFVESAEPQEVTTLFEVIPMVHSTEFNDCLTSYEDVCNYVLGLSLGRIIITAGYPVRVKMEATARVPGVSWGTVGYRGWRYVTHSFIVDEQFNLTQGELMEVDLRPYNIGYNLNVTKIFLDDVLRLVRELEAEGLYLFRGKKRLNAAEFFVRISEANLAEGKFRESYANMRQAYIISQDIEGRIDAMKRDASLGTLILIPLLAVNALVIAFLSTESKSLKSLLSLLLFAGLIGAMSLAYVGFRLTETKLVQVDTLLSAVICIALTRLDLKEERGGRERLSIAGAVSIAFSIAKRNLRKRRLRTFLVVSSMIVMVFAFVSLTSFGMGHGFVVRSVSGSAPRLGMFVQKSPPLEQAASVPFLPLDISVIKWLDSQEEAAVIAPKAQNKLGMSYLFGLSSSNGYWVNIFGAIGIVPSVESKVTSIDKIVEEGRFLSDADNDGVMLSAATAERLGLQPNDSLNILGNQFKLVGTFNGDSLEKLKDLDGASMLPKVKTGDVWALCLSEYAAIFTLPTALKFPFMILARVDVLTNSPSQIPNLSMLTALSLGVDVWASISNGIYRYYIGQSLEIQGETLVVPVLLVLGNVFSLTINSVYERKKEIFTMSTLGLTPTHVAAVFVAEGLIISFITGGVGYLIGLGSYQLMPFLASPLEVEQKVSIGWGFVALLFSVAVTLLGVTFPVLKASLLTTPSLARKWRLNESTEKHDDYWKIHLPVFIPETNTDLFFNHIVRQLKSYEKSTFQTVKNLSFREKERELSFTFSGYTDEDALEEIVVQNTVLIIPGEKKGFATAFYLYQGTRIWGKVLFREQHAHGMASFLRRIVFRCADLGLKSK